MATCRPCSPPSFVVIPRTSRESHCPPTASCQERLLTHCTVYTHTDTQEHLWACMMVVMWRWTGRSRSTLSDQRCCCCMASLVALMKREPSTLTHHPRQLPCCSMALNPFPYRYIQWLVHGALRRGLQCVVMNARGCGGSGLSTPRTFSGAEVTAVAAPKQTSPLLTPTRPPLPDK